MIETVSHDLPTLTGRDGKPAKCLVTGATGYIGGRLIRELLAHGYRVIVPDLRGNGNSDRPQNKQAYSDDAEIKDMMALAGHLQLDSYFALGYSRGAIVLAKLLTEEKKISSATAVTISGTIRGWFRMM